MAKRATGFREKIFRSNSKKRPGVHSKTKTSKLKKSRNYRKKYRGQGR